MSWYTAPDYQKYVDHATEHPENKRLWSSDAWEVHEITRWTVERYQTTEISVDKCRRAWRVYIHDYPDRPQPIVRVLYLTNAHDIIQEGTFDYTTEVIG